MRTSFWVALSLVTLTAAPRVEQARYLMAQNANFLQPDRLGMTDGPNEYAYAQMDPVDKADPFGTTVKAVDSYSMTALTNLISTAVGFAIYLDLSFGGPDVTIEQHQFYPARTAGQTITPPAACSASRNFTVLLGTPTDLANENGILDLESTIAQSPSAEPPDALIHEFTHVEQYWAHVNPVTNHIQAFAIEYLERRERGASYAEQAAFFNTIPAGVRKDVRDMSQMDSVAEATRLQLGF